MEPGIDERQSLPSACSHSETIRHPEWSIVICSRCGAVIGDLEEFGEFIKVGIGKHYSLRLLAEKFHHELPE